MRLFALLLILLVPAALHAQDDMAAMTATDSGDHAATADDAYKQAMQGMMKTMKSPMTGDADKDFVAMMLAHHQGAVDMAAAEQRYGKDKEMRKLAGAIIKAQNKEIDQMRKWQTKHGVTAAPPTSKP